MEREEEDVFKVAPISQCRTKRSHTRHAQIRVFTTASPLFDTAHKKRRRKTKPDCFIHDPPNGTSVFDPANRSRLRDETQESHKQHKTLKKGSPLRDLKN